MRRAVALITGLVVLAVGLPTAAAAEGTDPAGSTDTVAGELQRLAVDMLDGSAVELTVVVPTDGEAVRVQAEDVADVPTGSVVEVEVDTDDEAAQDVRTVDGGVAVEDLDVVSTPADAVDVRTQDFEAAGLAAAVEGGTRPVAVLTGRFTGQAASSVTAGVLATDIASSVDPYWSQSTGGQVRFAVQRSADVGSYGAPPATTAQCTVNLILDVLDWATRAISAWEMGNPYHVVLYTPRVSACGFAGVGHVSDGGAAWINGANNRWQTIAHELGHTLTLGHSDTLVQCPAQDGTYATCRHGEYGDAYDIMGTSTGGAGLLSGAHLDALGLVPLNSMTTVTESQQTRLAPVGGATGTRFLRFTAAGATYYVEYRAAVGRDSDLGVSRGGCPLGVSGCTPVLYQPGVVVRRVEYIADGEPTYLLDADTSSGWFALDAGETFRTADMSVAVTVTSSDLSGATVVVEMVDTTPQAPFLQIVASPDVTGNRIGDVFAVDQAGRLFLYGGIGGGRVTLSRVYGTGWDALRLFAPGDWNGDGRADLVGADAAGDLWLYPGAGSGAFGAKSKIGNGWNGFRIVPGGDMNGDRRADLLAIDPDERLWLYPGNGLGSFSRRIQVGNGWGGFDLFAAGDANRDGRNDILSIDASGRLWYYAGRGGGYFAMRKQVGNGWLGFGFASGADLNADGYGDLVGRDPNGVLWFYAGRYGGTFAMRQQIGVGW